MQDLNNTVWWITGASSGIGKGIAQFLLKKNAKVVLSSRNEAALIKVAQECNIAENQYLILPLDVNKMDDIDVKVKMVIDKFSRIDYLVNNAGISQRSIASETSIEVDRKIMETNFFGTVILTKAVLPIMIQQKSGNISAVSSVVGKFGFPLRSAYSASKHALHGFFESLRAENKKNNINVSMIIPGRINTSVSNNALTEDGSQYGKLDDGQANSISPDAAAKIIVRGILKRKKEILVGGKELLMVHIRRWIPSLYYYLSNKVSAT
jgi:short-subunit dehydrogenase